VHVLARAPDETGRPDRGEVRHGGSVKEELRRLPRGQPEIDLHRVPLIGADAETILGEPVTLLVAGANDLPDHLFAQRVSAARRETHDVRHHRPALSVELEPDEIRPMSEEEAQELARADEGILHSAAPSYRVSAARFPSTPAGVCT
jgi:hypothetical protein